MPRAHRAIAVPSVTQRTRIGNGNALFLDVDERGPIARRFREVLAQIIADIGGVENVTEAQTAIARRAVTLIIWCESIEAELAAGKALDVGEYSTAANSLRRLLADLGLERRARDVTPTLQQYLEGKARRGYAEAET
jgi:hypothetical protein